MKQRTRKLLTLLLIAAMVMSLAVPAFADNTAYTAYSETPYTYDAGDYTFGKISHADKAPGTADGIVDYTGDGTVAVTGTVEGADGQGDRGQSYSWSAMAYGDYVYVGAVEGGDGNGDSAAGDYAALAGAWFMDADAAAESIIEIDEYGNWSLAERPGGDGDPTEVDCGTLEVNSADEGQYFAVSTLFDDVVYDMTVIGDDVMYWGGENDYYQKMA